MNKKIGFIIALFFFLFAFPVKGGGPFMVDEVNFTGKPSLWEFDANTKEWVINFQIDKGVEGVRIGGQLVEAMILELFDKWKNLKLPNPEGPGANPQFIDIVSLRVEYDGLTDEDIDENNYSDYLREDIHNPPPTVIMFDAHGEILRSMCLADGNDDEYCLDYMNGLAGLAAPLNRRAETLVIQNGFVLLNGRLVDLCGSDNCDPKNEENDEMHPEQFKAVIVHEIGHLFNIAHAQVNLAQAEDCHSFDCAGGTAITTMFPSAKSEEQFLMHRDDIVAMALMYPKHDDPNNPDITSKFCTIRGEILQRAKVEKRASMLHPRLHCKESELHHPARESRHSQHLPVTPSQAA